MADSASSIKVICVCGARPNFMKVAPLVEAFKKTGRVVCRIVHTGQHYDENMSKLFFDELGIPKPDINLEVGSGSHAVQTAEVMKRFEQVCLDELPDWVVVVGDVNSTIACALVARKLGIRVAHVEAGLRSFDRAMPEEINRVLTDSISDELFVSEPSGMANLKKEGVDEARVHFVGNVMIDTLLRHRERADRSDILERLSLSEKSYAVVTLHRPSNVDDPAKFSELLGALDRIAQDQPVVFPVHPRTRGKLAEVEAGSAILKSDRWVLIDPVGYLDFLKLMSAASLVLTDSGGMQEETTILGVPCITLRENTERPVTISEGTNRLAGTSAEAILGIYEEVRSSQATPDKPPKFWDGRAAERIASVLISS